MKKKTLIRLFLTSSICLICLTGCNKEVEPVTSEVVSESVEVVSGDTSIEDTSIEETVSEETDVTSEVESVDTSEDVSETVVENEKVNAESEFIEVKNTNKTDKVIPGMPSADQVKYNNYIKSVESTEDTEDVEVTESEQKTEQKQKTSEKKKVAKEEVKQTPIEVVNPNAEASVTNVSQEMANLLNAKRGELGFPQTVEVIPESETYLHDVMKQGVINLGTVEFSHEVNNGLGNGLNLLGSVIGKSTIKDSTNMFNSWMNSPGHYSTLMPTDANHLHSDDVLQIVCYVYGPVDGYYYYELNTRFKAKEIKKEEWQEPYINPEQPTPTPGVSDGGSTPGATVDTNDENGYIDNYGDEIVLDSLIGTDAFWKYFENCSPELQEHYKQKHPELFN